MTVTARLLTTAVALLALWFGLPSAASALPLTGGTTSVQLTGATELDSIGVDLGLLGSASFDGIGRVVFPITGGDVDLSALTGDIEHDGSGVSLIKTRSGNVYTIALENFEIDLTSDTLFADVSFFTNGMLDSQVDDLAVFDVRSCLLSAGSDPCPTADGMGVILNGFGLRIADGVETSIAEFLFSDAQPGDIGFVERLLDDLDFGVAFVEVVPGQVPEPATAGLLLAGLGGLWIAGRRRRASAR